MFSYTGKFRLYFNRGEDAPNIWSIDDGSHQWEICVPNWVIEAGVCTHSGSDLTAQWPNPKAWVDGEGVVTICPDGTALISAR